MDITVNNFYPDPPIPGHFYLIGVKKGKVEVDFIVEIAKLPEEYHGLFGDQYDQKIIENDFLYVDFYDYRQFSKLAGKGRYTGAKELNMTRSEIIQFVEEGLATTLIDFITNNKYIGIIAIAAKKVMSDAYESVLSENAQEVGYNYNKSYTEHRIHVIEP